nr:hypothetical protein [Candidatus Korarchaeota archaeon]NIU85681.1 hypothetical protein [Candidatus Thorarchaeota archaeon]NIW53690.1 hypothetical protein [Candidatus Korarchaeota archaeon]
MEEKEVNRLIYALPYISILEQNYGRLKESLDLSEPSEVRKIHSSTETIFEEEKKNAVKRKIKKIVTDDDFFNYPVICTTNVAFFNAIVKFAKKRKYRFSSLANSIVILDEIQ